MDKIKVLFICVHNSARSQMAEALLKKLGGEKFEVESAGLDPGTLNPLAVGVMKEIGLDISGNKTKGVLDLYRAGKTYDYVIAVCAESDAGRCPVFPGKVAILHWVFDDPSQFTGPWEERLAKTRVVRDAIAARISEWLPNV